MNENILIVKFGGAALATPSDIEKISEIILLKKTIYKNVVVVLSAMGNTTNNLIDLAKEIHPNPPEREYDMLVTSGERISISLLAMALAKRGENAKSFTGSQSGIITTDVHSNAEIVDVRPHRLLSAIQEGSVVIVAGFQGVSLKGEITTLGRGGSDTTAVALAVALNASKVEFYKDVCGIYDKDPKLNPSASLFLELSYEQAIQIISAGAKVLHQRSLLLAQKNGIVLHVKSFVDKTSLGTIIGLNEKSMNSEPVYELELDLCECGLSKISRV